jgi:hypothetical protein
MMKMATLVILVSCIVTSCSPSISDEDAQAVIKESLWNDVPVCKFRQTLSISTKTASEPGYEVNQYPPPVDCARQFKDAGLADYYLKNNGDDLFLIPKGVGRVSEYWFVFNCGTRGIEQVISKEPENKKVIIRYSRRTELNKGLIDRLSNCPIEVPKDGVEEKRAVLRRDNSDKWVID